MKTKVLMTLLLTFCTQLTFAEQSDRNKTDVVGEICNNYSATYEKQDCLSQFAGKKVSPNAGPVCLKYSANYERQDCASSLADLFISNEALQICLDYSANYERQDCLKSLGDLQITQAAFKTCLHYNANYERQDCFKQVGTPVRKRGGRVDTDILEKLIQAREALNYGDTSKALSILNETIEKLK